MNEELKIIAYIHTDFKEKFGIPRQSGLVGETRARIIFEKEYRTSDAIKGIDEFSHLWLIWGFSKVKQSKFQATVAPPRLGGKVKKGVFATRSPFRPNKLGLSSVELVDVIWDSKNGPVLVVAGADLMDMTPIYDIKPYLAYTDSHPDASGSFGEAHKDDCIEVVYSEDIFSEVDKDMRRTIVSILSQDPRAAYNKGPEYIYGMSYGEYDIRFQVQDDVLRIVDIIKTDSEYFEKVK